MPSEPAAEPPFPDYHIRRVTVEELERLVEIERQSEPDPWPAAHFLDFIESDWVRRGIFLGDDLVAYLFAFPEKRGLHVANIAVDPKYRRRGYATILLKSLYQSALRNRIHNVILEVRCSNHPALQLYYSEGFKLIGVRKRYYTDTDEDALILNKELKRL